MAPGCGFSPLLKTVIRWNIYGLYKAKARRLLKRITENKGSLDRNEAGMTLVYVGAIPRSNFVIVFYFNGQQATELAPFEFNEFIGALQSFVIKINNLSCETLKYKYTNDAPYKIHHHLTHAFKKKKSSSSDKVRLKKGNSYAHTPLGRDSNILYVY